MKKVAKTIVASTIITLIGVQVSAQDDASNARVEEYRLEAYKLGWADGWKAARSQFGNIMPPGGTTTSSTTTKFELPKSFFSSEEDATTKSFIIPDNWYVAPSTSGEAVYARVNKDGSVQPYIKTPSGEIEVLEADQAPLWTTEPNIQKFLKGLPKTESGLTFIPVQPATANK